MLAVFLIDSIFGRSQALGGGIVGELHFAGYVTDGEDAGDAGAAAVVGFDEAAPVRFQAGFIQFQAVGDGPAADGAQEQVRLKGFIAEFGGDAIVGGLEVFQSLAGEDTDAKGFLHVAAHFATDIRIEQEQNVLKQLHNCDFHSQVRRHAGQFATDEAAAQNRHAGGQLGDVQKPAAVHHARVPGKKSRHGRGGTRGDDDLPGANGGAIANENGVAVLEGSCAGELLDAVGGEELFDAALELADDSILLTDHGGVVHRRAGDGDAEGLGVFDFREGVSRGDQRLGGDAAPVEAGAAELLLFDNGDRGA